MNVLLLVPSVRSSAIQIISPQRVCSVKVGGGCQEEGGVCGGFMFSGSYHASFYVNSSAGHHGRKQHQLNGGGAARWLWVGKS